MLLCVILCKVVLTCKRLDEILKCDRSNENYRAELSCGAVYYDVERGSNSWDRGCNLKVVPFKQKLLSSTLLAHSYDL